jgi:uncharacterized membrane protein YeaQ/YmgE (transglycosylase-associated protein family)
MEFVWFILIGAVAGWLGGQIFKGSGLGLLGNIIVGILGGLVGGWIAGKLGISIGAGILGSLLTATGGAIILLFIASLVKKS